MEFDLKGIWKDHQKMLLSMLALLVLAILIGNTGSKSGFGDLSSLSGTNGNSPSSTGSLNNGVDNTPVAAVNNGKANKYSVAPTYSLDSDTDYTAIIKTSEGDIKVDLYEEDASTYVNNFVYLAKDGFYDSSSFHRIINGFIIQGGDPQGDGYGGPGYYMSFIKNTRLEYKPYTLAVVVHTDRGGDVNGSQFFITSKGADTSSLQGQYPIFGIVTDGYDVVDTINSVAVKTSDPNKYMPYEPVYIYSVQIEEDKKSFLGF